MKQDRTISKILEDEFEAMPFDAYLQQKIDRLSWLIKDPDIITNHKNFLRVAIVTKHSLIDFARILKGRKSAQESLWKGGATALNNQLMNQLMAELIGAGLRPPERKPK